MITFKMMPSEPDNDMLDAIKDDLMRGIFVDGYKRMFNAAQEIKKPYTYLVWHDGQFSYCHDPLNNEEIKNIYFMIPLYTQQPPEPVQTITDAMVMAAIVYKYGDITPNKHMIEKMRMLLTAAIKPIKQSDSEIGIQESFKDIFNSIRTGGKL